MHESGDASCGLAQPLDSYIFGSCLHATMSMTACKNE